MLKDKRGKVKMRNPFILSVVILVLVFGGSVGCFAAEGVIYGCVNKKGEIRIVSDCAKCEPEENCVFWNKAEPSRQPGRRTRRSSGFHAGERYLLDPQGRNVYQPLP